MELLPELFFVATIYDRTRIGLARWTGRMDSASRPRACKPSSRSVKVVASPRNQISPLDQRSSGLLYLDRLGKGAACQHCVNNRSNGTWRRDYAMAGMVLCVMVIVLMRQAVPGASSGNAPGSVPKHCSCSLICAVTAGRSTAAAKGSAAHMNKRHAALSCVYRKLRPY